MRSFLPEVLPHVRACSGPSRQLGRWVGDLGECFDRLWSDVPASFGDHVGRSAALGLCGGALAGVYSYDLYRPSRLGLALVVGRNMPANRTFNLLGFPPATGEGIVGDEVIPRAHLAAAAARAHGRGLVEAGWTAVAFGLALGAEAARLSHWPARLVAGMLCAVTCNAAGCVVGIAIGLHAAISRAHTDDHVAPAPDPAAA